MPQPVFSPSPYHLDLMARTERSFAWTGQDFATWQAELRERLVELLGGFPDEKADLDVRELEREETEDYARTKLVFRAEPLADVPAHLLVPRGVDGPRPAMICLQGHSPGMHISVGEAHNEQERESIAGDRDFAVQAARQGFVALALEQRCFGEREEADPAVRGDNRCLYAVIHSFLLGRTMLGERVWDVIRAIDLLQGRPEVDPDRVGCMGNSGGGTVTFYAACVDERIGLAVPSCCFCTYDASLMRIPHCACNCIPGVLKVAEMGELAGLIAPRRLLVVAGETDGIFPIEGVREAFGTAGKIFAAAGCPENLRLVVGPEGHRFYADLAWPAVREMTP